MQAIDHVVMEVRDLDEATARLWDEHGLASIPGGRHPGWGTGNRIVPLGRDYVELISVVDVQEAAGSVFGRTMLQRIEAGDGWFAVCVADDDLESTAARLGLEVHSGSRTRPDGEVVLWRSAGLDDPRREPWMPFFIAWDVPSELHPSRAAAVHRADVTGIAWVEVAGDQARLHAWLGGSELPIRIADGDEPGIRRVALRTTGGGELIVT